MSLGAKKSEIHAEFFVTRLGCEPLNTPRLSCVPGAVRSVAVGGGSGPLRAGGAFGRWTRVGTSAPPCPRLWVAPQRRPARLCRHGLHRGPSAPHALRGSDPLWGPLGPDIKMIPAGDPTNPGPRSSSDKPWKKQMGPGAEPGCYHFTGGETEARQVRALGKVSRNEAEGEPRTRRLSQSPLLSAPCWFESP